MKRRGLHGSICAHGRLADRDEAREDRRCGEARPGGTLLRRPEGHRRGVRTRSGVHPRRGRSFRGQRSRPHAGADGGRHPREAPCPVFIIPGNHDPLVPGAVWEDRSWEAARNVVVFSENTPYELPGATLYPCPLRGKQSDADPTSWIRAEGGDRIHIGLAHGSVEGAPIGEWDHPIPRDAASRSGLDYLALGHWHSFGLFGTKDAPRTAYSGTHEPTSFGERDSGNALIVDIEAPGCAPVLTPVRTGGISWISIEEQVDSRDALESVRERIGTLQNPERTLLRVRLSGLMRPDDRDALEEIALAAASFLWSEVDESGLLPSPEDDSWIANLPAGLLREVGKRLRHTQEAPEIRTKALLELYALLSEVKA